MNDFQKLEKELTKLNDIDRSKEEKAATFQKIKNKIYKDKSNRGKPFFAGLATAAVLFLISIITINLLGDFANQSAGDTTDSGKGDTKLNLALPGSFELKYEPIILRPLARAETILQWEKVDSQPFYGRNDQMFSLDLYKNGDETGIHGVLMSENQSYNLGNLSSGTDRESIEQIETFTANISYPNGDSEFVYLGAFGSHEHGYTHVFYETEYGSFFSTHSSDYLASFDLNGDGLDEIGLLYEERDSTALEIIRWNQNRLEKASIIDSFTEQFGHKEHLTFQFVENQMVITHKKQEISAVYTIVNDRELVAFTDEELKQHAKNLWTYEMEVNGEVIPASGIMEVAEGDFDISIVERQPPYLFMPAEVFYAERISGIYHEHVNKISPEPDEITGADGTIVTAAIYQYRDVESGTTIQIEITDELKERMKLETNVIQIIVK